MKKQSATKQILNILNTKGGRKPKDLIKEIKLPASSIYAGLAYLRDKKMIAKEDDGVYITQSLKMPLYKEKAVSSKVTNKTTPTKYEKAETTFKYIRSLETQVHELEKLHDGWRQNYKKLEADYTQAKIMYLDSQAVVKYLEEKVAQLLKG
jgi:hypothetical protein